MEIPIHDDDFDGCGCLVIIIIAIVLSTILQSITGAT